MKKLGAIFVACAVFMFSDAANLIIDEGKRAEYGSALALMTSHVSQGNTMLDWSRIELKSVSKILEKTSIHTEDYRQTCSTVMNVLPAFSGRDERVLKKILAFSLLHLLKEDIYDFIGSSFYSEDEDLDGIVLDEKKLTATEFVQIQSILEADLEKNGIVGNGTFSKALDTIAKGRGK